MTASTDLTASGAGLATSPGAGSAQEMASQMADVAAAMFAFLLLRAPAAPVDHDVPHATPVEHTDVAVVMEAPAVPVLTPSVPALAVAIASLDLDPSPLPAAVPSIAMPTSLPMPDLLPQLAVEPTQGETPSAPDLAIPVIASTPAPTMAMLNEIEFLDE